MTNSGPVLWRETVYSLRGGADSIAQARDHARDFFTPPATLITPEELIDVLLVVSELVTNAVLHAPGPCALLLREDEQQLTISVSDTGAGVLNRREPGSSGLAGGYGWHLLHRLCGTVRTEVHASGKTTTVEMSGHSG